MSKTVFNNACCFVETCKLKLMRVKYLGCSAVIVVNYLYYRCGSGTNCVRRYVKTEQINDPC